MKMLIDKIKLKLLLEQKREYIKHPKEGIDILITAILYIVSLLCSDFKSVFGINSLIIQTLAWVIAVILIVYGFYKLIKSSKLKYDHNKLLYDIENLNEIIHRFSLIAIKDDFETFSNKFLLYYDAVWKCWFFFSFSTTDYDNEESIIQRLSNKLKVNRDCISLKYITTRIQPKFSEPDQVQKVYQHSLYRGKISDFPPDMLCNEFEIDGTRYKWWTIEEMEQDIEIMEKNRDVVSFVKEKIN